MKMKGNKQGGNTFITGIGIGAAVAIILSALLTAALAGLIGNGKLAERAVDVSLPIIRFLSVLIGGLIGTSVSKEKVLPVIGGVSLGYLILLIALGIAIYDGSFHGFGLGVLSVGIGALAVTGIRLKANSKQKHRVRIRK